MKTRNQPQAERVAKQFSEDVKESLKTNPETYAVAFTMNNHDSTKILSNDILDDAHPLSGLKIPNDVIAGLLKDWLGKSYLVQANGQDRRLLELSQVIQHLGFTDDGIKFLINDLANAIGLQIIAEDSTDYMKMKHLIGISHMLQKEQLNNIDQILALTHENQKALNYLMRNSQRSDFDDGIQKEQVADHLQQIYQVECFAGVGIQNTSGIPTFRLTKHDVSRIFNTFKKVKISPLYVDPENLDKDEDNYLVLSSEPLLIDPMSVRKITYLGDYRIKC